MLEAMAIALWIQSARESATAQAADARAPIIVSAAQPTGDHWFATTLTTAAVAQQTL